MAFVGPRPLPVAYRDRYSPEELRRHDVRPGLTGWAQINGRNEVDWNDRLAMDVWYVDHRSRTLDLKIIARTVHAVLEQRGISSGTSSTMEELKHYAERGGSAP
jgi:lipopolysaccharide/colanic/teichoic acid biosynthesis glycosyltransferase